MSGPPATPEIVLVFLDEEAEKLYQLKQWIQPLERLSRKRPVAVWHSSERAAEILAATRLLPVFLGSPEEVLRQVLERPAKVYLYMNQSALNFLPLRDGRGIHVFVSHGESDKAYMYQNTIKRFDLCFAAGDAAIERLRQHVAGYDVSQRVMKIGRPQILDHHVAPGSVPSTNLTRVLYAPTWEGVTRATRYSSIHSHGRALVGSLLETGRFQVIYRPHPMAGTRDAEIRAADLEIRNLIAQANRKLPGPLHHVDASPFGWHLESLDVMITDISAVAYDWLATGKALLLTRPTEKKAVVSDFPLIRKLRPLEPSDSKRIPELVVQALKDANSETSPLSELLHHYYGDRSESDDQKFERAVTAALELRKTIPLSDQDWCPVRSGTNDTASRIMRRCNTIARKLLRMAGIWDPNSLLKRLKGRKCEFYVHFSDPFGIGSLRKAAEILDDPNFGKTGQAVIGTNQVTSWAYLSALSWLRSTRSGSRDSDFFVLPVPTPMACEHATEVLQPDSVRYLKHHRHNQMMLRLNGTSHELYYPESDPEFEPDHTLIAYDVVRTNDSKTRGMISRLLEISRPKVR